MCKNQSCTGAKSLTRLRNLSGVTCSKEQVGSAFLYKSKVGITSLSKKIARKEELIWQ